MKPKCNELNTESIRYIQKCFNYCISQYSGDSVKLATALENIPYHFFNQHDNCGQWCNFSKNKESYRHSVIDKGFKDRTLFINLKTLFSSLAKKSSTFSSGASSNVNESINAMLVSKSSKSRMYGLSPAADFRAACTVNKKNDGEQFIDELGRKLNLSLGKYTSNFNKNLDFIAKKRYQRSLTQNFKRRQLFLKKRKTNLRNKKEMSEGIMYESNLVLLEQNETLPVANISDKLEKIVVYFDLETGGLNGSADILQIACKYKSYTFSVYIKPTQKIDEKSTSVTGLKCIDGFLCLHGCRVETVSLLKAMTVLYEFLFSLKKKCVMTAHNCRFDYPRLVNAIKKNVYG